MNPENENQDFTRTQDFDPFPKPQTIPSGWDLSEFLSPPEEAPAPESDYDPDNSTK
jgi:hypothetical protein